MQGIRDSVVHVFFFNDTATTEIYTLSLHDALPICSTRGFGDGGRRRAGALQCDGDPDRKSTRLNSSHANISHAVFCLKKKNTTTPGYHACTLARRGAAPLLPDLLT